MLINEIINLLFAIFKKELQDRRKRAKFREQVLPSLSFEDNTSFDQVINDFNLYVFNKLTFEGSLYM